ncbi:hypothetical protein PQX77_014316 [Marasmius sp. AFHP31]|nr:hypothetical protein PQX77_014316 [Marasmius sp. AFHP31]
MVVFKLFLAGPHKVASLTADTLQTNISINAEGNSLLAEFGLSNADVSLITPFTQSNGAANLYRWLALEIYCECRGALSFGRVSICDDGPRAIDVHPPVHPIYASLRGCVECREESGLDDNLWKSIEERWDHMASARPGIDEALQRLEALDDKFGMVTNSIGLRVGNEERASEIDLVSA